MVRAEIAGLSLEDAARLLERRFARGAAEPAQQYMLGSLLLRLDRPEEAAHVFSASCAISPPQAFWHHCRVGEALARARMARARGVRAPLLPLRDRARGALVSVVMCSIKPERFAQASAQYRELLKDVPHEIVGIHDARSLCEGYNRGLRRSKGELVVFSHDDIRIISRDFAAKLYAGLAEADLLGVAGSDWMSGTTWAASGGAHTHGQVAHPNEDGAGWEVAVYGVRARSARGIEAFDGVLFAARRDAADRVGFDEERFDGWHFYDLDFSFRAAQMGYRLAVRNDLLLCHFSRGRYDEAWRRYAKRFTAKHRGRLRPRPAPSLQSARFLTDDLEEWPDLTEQLIALPGDPDG
ncbi:MAG: glycosyltransferase [Betaproteobacteria bacterium]|nr:glycosyltransferase [Betaproteobacteria bacterium]